MAAFFFFFFLLKIIFFDKAPSPPLPQTHKDNKIKVNHLTATGSIFNKAADFEPAIFQNM